MTTPGVDITADRVREIAPDALILATGASYRLPNGDFDGAHLVSAWDVIKGTVQVGNRVVVADWRCDWIGLGSAEKLASEGCSVRLCVNGEIAGETIQVYVRYMWAAKLQALGVATIPYVRMFGADEDTAYFQHIVSNDPVILEDVDTVVFASGHDSETSLQRALVGEDLEMHVIGDSLSPRTAEEAVLEGLKAGFIV